MVDAKPVDASSSFYALDNVFDEYSPDKLIDIGTVHKIQVQLQNIYFNWITTGRYSTAKSATLS